MKALLVFLASATALCARFEPGVLPPSWRSSGPVCEAVPDWQVHEYNSDFWILRESGGINYEKPFLCVLFLALHVMISGAMLLYPRFPSQLSIRPIFPSRKSRNAC